VAATLNVVPSGRAAFPIWEFDRVNTRNHLQRGQCIVVSSSVTDAAAKMKMSFLELLID